MRTQSTPKPIIFWIVSLATLFAALTRFAGLFRLPPQAWVDEIWFALRARDLVQTGAAQVFYKTFWGGVNPMLVYLTALAEWWVARNLIVASRLVSTASSLLSVPLLYACLCEFWRGDEAINRRWLAAVSALLMAGFFSVVVLSRLGTEPALALAASLFCLWQWRRGLRTGSGRAFVLAGLGAGWAQYVSPHARFIPIVMAAWGLHALLISPARRRANLRGMGLAAVVALVTALPLAVFFAQEPEWFLGRARAVTTGAAQRGLADFVLENARRLALAFSVTGDLNPRDNLAGRPYLDWLQSIGFYLGLGWSAWRIRRSAQARDLLIWLGVMVVPPLITDNAPSFSRLILAAPPALALIVLGWDAAWARLRARVAAPASVALAGLVVAASLGVNVYDYFVRYAAQPDLASAFTTVPVTLAREMRARARTGAVFVERVAEAQEDIYAFDFILPGTAVRRLDFRQCLPLVDRRPALTTYLVWSERDSASVAELRRNYPAAEITAFELEPEALVSELTRVEIPAGVAAPAFAHPAQAVFAPGLRLLGYDLTPARLRPGESVFLTLYWRAEGHLDDDAVAFVHIGTGLSGSTAIAQRDGQPCQGFYPTSRWQIGDVVPDRFAIILPPDAPPGQYPIAVGWYHYPSLQRLPLSQAEQALPDNRAVIGTLTVSAP